MDWIHDNVSWPMGRIATAQGRGRMGRPVFVGALGVTTIVATRLQDKEIANAG
jgi:hypothetical protein